VAGAYRSTALQRVGEVMTIIPINDPGARFDFKAEAINCAVNEACSGDDTTCTVSQPCVFCLTLAHLIEKALLRAFVAGQASILEAKREQVVDSEAPPGV